MNQKEKAKVGKSVRLNFMFEVWTNCSKMKSLALRASTSNVWHERKLVVSGWLVSF